ncbi:MAG: nodulation protein NfeD [Gemmatimonadales bacterium]|nr:nodulation protein NfeD [Gemmatimonadales bacterium]
MSTCRPGLITCLAICLVLLFSSSGSAGEIHLLTFDGPITPVAAEYLVQGIQTAEDEGAEAVIIQLDTPGGLDSSMRQIVKAELNALVPVVVFVAPAGSRSASAGAFITLAAHVAAMAPETNIGSASPVQMGGASMDSTMSKKVTNDAAAYIASIASRKERNPEMARSFVEQAVNLTAAEALEHSVIDIIAPNLPALLDSLQGRTVHIQEKPRTLETAGARLIEHQLSPRQKFLKRLADPNLAYILMLLGIYGLFFELSHPGALAPGILGSISLLLALFAFQALPIDYTGVGLILLGMILLILEVKVPSFGALSIGGVISLVLGSLMLFESTEEWARLSLGVMIPSVIVFAGFFLLCAWLVLRSQKRPASSGAEALIGETGRVVQAIEGGTVPGKIVFHGEVWDAIAQEPIAEGSRIRVAGVEGRLAKVELIVSPSSSNLSERNSS